jgi:hypothetical protein
MASTDPDDPQLSHKKTLFEITITQPKNRTIAERLNGKRPSQQAEAQEKAKVKKYDDYLMQHPELPDFHFLPLAIETHGAMTTAGLQLFTRLAEIGETSIGIPKAILRAYFLKRTSCVVQRAIARNVLDHCRLSRCKPLANDRSMDPQELRECNEFRVPRENKILQGCRTTSSYLSRTR